MKSSRSLFKQAIKLDYFYKITLALRNHFFHARGGKPSFLIMSKENYKAFKRILGKKK